MRILVTGGAGYIGSHTVVQLAARGYDVVVVDNFVNAKPSVMGRLEALVGHPVELVEADVRDAAALDAAFAARPVDAVIHFAGMKAVGESVERPLDYYDNNLGSTITLVRAMVEHGVSTIVFSSSATVYGADPTVPMTEGEPTSATNPYGWTKVMSERILTDAAAGPGLRVALLRYFNPVGAHASGTIGEDPQGIPNNLVPFIAQVAVGRRERVAVFGGDYPTPDGTCQRDYIHVEDLAAGHLAALDALADRDGVHVWNLGTGRPTSVLEMVAAFEEASGRPIPYDVVDRRPGDVAVSYADPARAERELGWTAERSIAEMCADVWRWQAANPNGYP